MKKSRLLLLTVILSLCMGSVAYAGTLQGYETVGLVIDGKKINSDVPPVLLSDRTMVPIRVISESLNATVNYDPATNNVIITTSGITSPGVTPARVTGQFMGLPKVGVLVNGKALSGDVAPVIINDRTLVPVRMVAQALGAKVDFRNGVVYIDSAGLKGSAGGENGVNLDDLSINEGTTNIDELSDYANGTDGLDFIDNEDNSNPDQALLDTNNI